MLKQQNRPFMTIPECAEEFGFPVATVRRLVQDGAFPVMKVGSASYIMRETFHQYLQSFELPASTPASFSTAEVDKGQKGEKSSGEDKRVEVTE